jgi:hypothetical protein
MSGGKMRGYLLSHTSVYPCADRLFRISCSSEIFKRVNAKLHQHGDLERHVDLEREHPHAVFVPVLIEEPELLTDIRHVYLLGTEVEHLHARPLSSASVYRDEAYLEAAFAALPELFIVGNLDLAGAGDLA